MENVAYVIAIAIFVICVHQSTILVGGIAKGGSDYWKKWGTWVVCELLIALPLCYFLTTF